jgi:hypothetical protein
MEMMYKSSAQDVSLSRLPKKIKISPLPQFRFVFCFPSSVDSGYDLGIFLQPFFVTISHIIVKFIELWWRRNRVSQDDLSKKRREREREEGD